MEAIGASGLAIDGLFGTHRVRGLGCATDPAQLDGPYAAVLMTVKAYDTAAMAAAVARHLARDGFLLSLQNGLGNVEAAARAIGAARVLGARVIFGAELVAPGHARVTVYADPVLIGSPDPTDGRRQDAAARWAAELSAAGIPAKLTGMLMAELWAKVLYNAALNPLGALLGVPYGDLPADRDTRMIMDAVIEEAFAVARAEGVELTWPDAAAYRDVFYGRLVPSTAAPRPSMRQDIVRRFTNIQARLHREDPASHPRDAETAYAPEPKELFAALREGEAPGARVKAFYHSHTRVGAYFSGEDRARAMFGDEPAYPEVVYVVVSDSRTPGEARAFRWSESARDFVEVPIEVC